MSQSEPSDVIFTCCRRLEVRNHHVSEWSGKGDRVKGVDHKTLNRSLAETACRT